MSPALVDVHVECYPRSMIGRFFRGRAQQAQQAQGDPDANAFCVLCARPRSDVSWLVAGEKGAACDGCLAYSIAWLDTTERANVRPFETSFLLVRTLMRQLGERAPFASTHVVVNAGIALANGHPAWLRVLAADAGKAHNAEAALHALGAIARDDRTDADRVNRAYYLCKLERFDEVLALVGKIASDAHPLDVAIACINEASALLGSDGAAPDLVKVEAALEEAEEHLATAERMKRAEGDVDPALYRAPIAHSRAEVAFLRGDAGSAREILSKLDADVVDGRLLGDIVVVTEGKAAAREIWRQELERAHPETGHARRLRARLA